MMTIELDYSRTGTGRQFRTPLFLSEAQSLHVGDQVVVRGDAVPERRARVVELDVEDPQGPFEFVDEPLADSRPPVGRVVKVSASR